MEFIMTNEIVEVKESEKPNKYESIQNFIVRKMLDMEGVMFGDCFPLKHTFTKGICLREINVPAGHLILTKYLKVEHAIFLLKGDVSILDKDGFKRLQAPLYFISKPGVQRVIYCHSDVTWVNTLVTEETDISKIEEEFVDLDKSKILDRTNNIDEEIELANNLKTFINGGEI